jgi:hypothetical protein
LKNSIGAENSLSLSKILRSKPITTSSSQYNHYTRTTVGVKPLVVPQQHSEPLP